MMLLSTEYNMPIKKMNLFPAQDYDKENMSRMKRKLLAAPHPSGRPSASPGIRRPPNAFIVSTKEWQRVVAAEHPMERNIQISAR
jgi:hypothetical protein